MAIPKPYRFENIPKYTLAQANLMSSLYDLIGARPIAQEFRATFKNMVRQSLKTEMDISFENVEHSSKQLLKKSLPDFPIIVVIGMPPNEHKILWELDPPICMGIIDKLLGGNGKPLRIHRPLTEIEQGVLSYMLLQVISIAQGNLNAGGQQALRLEKFLTAKEEIESMVDENTDYFSLGFKMKYQNIMGYSRVYFPHEVINTTFGNLVKQGGAPSDDELQLMRRNFHRLGPQKVIFRTQCAQLNLSEDEIQALEIGDIILLEDTDLKLQGAKLSGTVTATMVTGHSTQIITKLVESEGYYDLQIVEIATQEAPMADNQNANQPEQEAAQADEAEIPNENLEEDQAPVQEAAQEEPQAAPIEPDDNLAENQAFLRDVPSPLVVELGRIEMNMAQVIRLKPGQLLKLGRGISEPVNLVVKDKMFARGELLEVEGELGIRIIELSQ